MINVGQILQRVAACGYRVDLRDGKPELRPTRAGAAMPRPLLAALKDNRDAVIEWFRCRVCDRRTASQEDLDRLADPVFCQAFGSERFADGNGTVHEAEERCPYKPTRSRW